MTSHKSILPETLRAQVTEILEAWIAEQVKSSDRRADLINEADLRQESTRFLRLLQEASQAGNLASYSSAEWKPVLEFLHSLSRSRAQSGFSPTETAQFIFSLKMPLFGLLRKQITNNPAQLGEELSIVSLLMDRLGLYTTEIYQKTRDEVIRRQQEDMLELSTPVVKLWDGILALPIIGTLDSARTQVVMEALLQRIVDSGSEVAIIDITGVPHVDTLTAQHLLKTVTAARLMGADCIISGIRPQIAQTIVHLGVDMTTVTTKSTLADAFQIALSRTGKTVVRAQAPQSIAAMPGGLSSTLNRGNGANGRSASMAPTPSMDM